MKAIVTKYRGPTDTRGSRIIASDDDGNRVIVPYPHEAHDPHLEAARALCLKMGWRGKLVSGSTGKGRVFVWLVESAIVEVL